MQVPTIYTNARVRMGADPEVFITRNGKVIASEEVIPEKGITISYGSIVRDGIQAELQPNASHCRDILCGNIGRLMLKLKQHLDSLSTDDKKYSILVAPLRKVPQNEFTKITDNCKRFGCNPSMNYYEKAQTLINADPFVDRNRACGGHIHLGAFKDSNGAYDQAMVDQLHQFDTIVPLLDVVVGNTFVLLERMPGAKERREVYGLAGEYRPKPYGLEYRTLSNNWLRSRQLAHLAFGLARMAVYLQASGHAQKILDAVDLNEVREAINTNNRQLALKNFVKASNVWLPMTTNDVATPINEMSFRQFVHFMQKGMDTWFPFDPLDHWAAYGAGTLTAVAGSSTGISSFLNNTVRNDMYISALKQNQ